jgi:integrase
MLCMVFRKKRVKNGKAISDRLYRGRYRLDDDSSITEVSLNTWDKRVAQQQLEKIVREKQMEQAGILSSEPIRKAANCALEKHLDDFVADLTALRRDGQYIYELKNRVRKLIRECHWKQLKDITSDSFQTWRAKQNRSPKTLNEYLISVCGLLNWMEKHQRIARNPLLHVQKVQTNGTQVRPRRAFSDDEMSRLLRVAGPRKVLYLTAALTGLRRSELTQLESRDVHLEGPTPFLNVRASTTKNHQQATLALHADIQKDIASLLRELPVGEKRIFAHLMPTMDQFRAELTAAGIKFIDEHGLRADFHSLRHTLATNLARAGTAPRVAMEIMRHSDMRLTTKVYTDAGLLPISDAVLGLPSLVGAQANGPLPGTPPAFPTGQKSVETDNDGPRHCDPQTAPWEADGHGQSTGGQRVQNWQECAVQGSNL